MRLLIFWALLNFGFAPIAGALESRQEADPGRALDGMAEELRAEFNLPGLVICFRQGDHPAHSLVSGVKRRGRGAPLAVDDAMHLGSVSKPLTATVIGDLITEGKLDWDSRLFEVFPELEASALPAYRSVTVWDLLTHEAQFTPYTDDKEIESAPEFLGTPRQMREAFLAWAITQPQEIVPEGDEPYSNAGYAALAAMAERTTNETFEQLVQDRLYNRLGMASAGFGWPAASDPGAPWGHRLRDGVFEPHPPDDDYQLGPILAAAGDMHMSMPDLMKFAVDQLAALSGRDSAFDPEVIRRLHTSETGYGGGWYVRPAGHYHTGSAETFFALVLVSPARETVIALAANGSDAENEFSLAGKVMGRVYRAYDVLEKNEVDGAPVD